MPLFEVTAYACAIYEAASAEDAERLARAELPEVEPDAFEFVTIERSEATLTPAGGCPKTCDCGSESFICAECGSRRPHSSLGYQCVFCRCRDLACEHCWTLYASEPQEAHT